LTKHEKLKLTNDRSEALPMAPERPTAIVPFVQHLGEKAIPALWEGPLLHCLSSDFG